MKQKIEHVLYAIEALGALMVYDHPADLLAHYDESPFADQAGVR